MPEYKLPDPGEGLTEAEIVSWKVKVGDEVEINDIVVEVETAKSLVELPSPYAGQVSALLVEEGETVEVGTPIIRFGAEEGVPAAQPEPDAGSGQSGSGGDQEEIDLSNPAASGGGEGESLVGRSKADRGATRRPRKSSASARQVQGSFEPGATPTGPSAAENEAEEDAEEAVPAASVAAAPASPGAPALVPERATSPGSPRALAKPPVRKLARDLGVDIALVAATGTGGVVTRQDVQRAASRDGGQPDEAPTAPEAPAAGQGAGERERREPIKGVRRMMGQAMVDSAFSAPHVTEWVTVDVTRTMELVERLRPRREFRDVSVSPLLVLARAALLAMRRTPEINSYWDEAAQEVVYKSYVNLGIAAATPRGLVVPNVKEAQDLTLPELASELGDLVRTARSGKTQPADMSGGTFTITNVGVFGVDAGTPIINPGESAILCFGAVKKQPWVVESDDGDQMAIRQVTTLALSFDHRHVDGEKGSRFLADVAGILEDPGTALVF